MQWENPKCICNWLWISRSLLCLYQEDWLHLLGIRSLIAVTTNPQTVCGRLSSSFSSLCTQILLVRNPDLNIRTFRHCFFFFFAGLRYPGTGLKYLSLSLKISSHFWSERIWVSGLSVTPVLCRGHMSQMSHSTMERALLWHWSPWSGLHTLTIPSCLTLDKCHNLPESVSSYARIVVRIKDNKYYFHVSTQ